MPRSPPRRVAIVCAPESDAITALAARRLAHEPVARILGRKEFWGLRSAPQRRHLGAASRDRDRGRGGARRARSRIRLARFASPTSAPDRGRCCWRCSPNVRLARGIGTDVSLGALACARANAQAHDLASRSAFVCCDYGAALSGPFDLIVANPPYVTRAEIATLQPEVRGFDPCRALDGGPDGLDAYRAIAADARRLLAPEGILVLELGTGQLGSVSSMLTESGLAPAGHRHDLSGVARALVVKSRHESSTIQARKKALGLSGNTD